MFYVITGSLTGRNNVGVKFYYAIKILGEVTHYGTWEDGILYAGKKSVIGSNCGVYVGKYVLNG